MMKKQSIATRLTGTLAIPAVFAAVLFGLSAIGGKPLFATPISVNYFVLYAAIVMITTMALSINLGSGRFDFSLGAMAVLSSVLSAKLTDSLLHGGSGSAVVMLLLGVGIGAVLGLISGVLYISLRIPPIITSLGVTLIYEGVTFTVTSGKYLNAEVRNPSMSAFSGTWIWSALVILVVLALIYFIFDRTKFGYDYKALQNGQKVAVSTGIREVPNALICYLICGALMGVVGFLSAVRSSTINGGALNFGSIGIMFTAFLPMFIGGYIGRFSNDKLGYLIAALCMSLLNTAFAAFSNEISSSMQSIINAVLLVVFLIYLSNEGLLKTLFHRKQSA